MLQVNLRRWHVESQVYVGAFQYLLHKQKLTDQHRNEGNDKSMELQQLMILAKNLLCEIETAINNTRQLMPTVLSRKAMDHRLTFRNNNSNRFENRDVDDLDNKFTKVRFHEYLHNMLHVMRRPGKKNGQRKKKRNQMKSSQSGMDSGSFGSSIWSDESGPIGGGGGGGGGGVNRKRLRKRHRMGRMGRMGRNQSQGDNSDMRFPSDGSNSDVMASGGDGGMKRNGKRRNNNPNKSKRVRNDGTMEERNRRRMQQQQRRRLGLATKTTTSTNLPDFFMNNSGE